MSDLESDSKFERTIETKEMPRLMLVLDVDGVVTNPDTKKPNEGVILRIAHDLERGIPAAFVTGRSVSWVIENVMPMLEAKISNAKQLDHLLISGEKGSVSVSYKNGRPVKKIDEKIVMPPEIVLEAKEIISPYSDSVFFDNSKETMISIEIHGGNNKKEVQKQKDILAIITEEFKSLLKRKNMENLLAVEPTEIATDIQFVSQGKKLSAQHILEWLKNKNVFPDSYLVIGDSSRDAEAAEEFHIQGQNVTFGYVGKKELAEMNTPVTRAKNLFDEGTAEILDKMRKEI
jgi:hydroxymethylpyrimidine pyrophosphatase-like HAD family hydrolase